jgi:hypothetical protein
MTAAIFNLNHHAHYVHWHFFQMSVANIVVIVVMLVVFGLAIAVRLPGTHKSERRP